MSDDVAGIAQPGRDRARGDRPRGDRPEATILRFPSNRPTHEHHGGDRAPRLRDVIGAVLREERREQRRTLADVADGASVSLPYLSEVERGRKEVSSDVLDAIGTELDLPLVVILERSAQRLRAGRDHSPGRGPGMQCDMRLRSAA